MNMVSNNNWTVVSTLATYDEALSVKMKYACRGYGSPGPGIEKQIKIHRCGTGLLAFAVKIRTVKDGEE